MKKRRLKSLDDLRRWLADIGNRLETGDVDAAHARCVTYIASVMSGIIKDSDLEKRIEALETQMERKIN
ncbi:muramidase (phage lysozyme) [Desulfosalsimonas propionicica]|uniref:Muramidase (Phage lysozyme) n=1 Tax=Desulfosalsimonas propionicica TaxID=332175 RepID=A0A7W0HMK0_9BACT|nr:hypothetical protein [Desulfosalsimonas propionicica]MBA2883161.1 muramidase (phage lysozyme) [Desulfosalsimonas propionicica]